MDTIDHGGRVTLARQGGLAHGLWMGRMLVYRETCLIRAEQGAEPYWRLRAALVAAMLEHRTREAAEAWARQLPEHLADDLLEASGGHDAPPLEERDSRSISLFHHRAER